MTEVERYLFDVNGYLVVNNALTSNQLEAINQLMDEKIAQSPDPKAGCVSLSNALGWRGPMVDLIDNPRVIPYLQGVCSEQFRLDHTYAFSIKPGFRDGGAYILHGGRLPFSPNHHYGVYENRIYGAEVAVVYYLNDVNEGDGGFGCIPGTHKSEFNIPEEFRDLRKPQPAVRQVTGQAGSAVIFTETLAHGTLPWQGRRERRSLFYKYTPASVGLGEPYLDEMTASWPELTMRQRELLEAPNARGKDRKRLKQFMQ